MGNGRVDSPNPKRVNARCGRDGRPLSPIATHSQISVLEMVESMPHMPIPESSATLFSSLIHKVEALHSFYAQSYSEEGGEGSSLLSAAEASKELQETLELSTKLHLDPNMLSMLYFPEVPLR